MIHPTLHRSFALFLYEPSVTHTRLPALSPVASQEVSVYVDWSLGMSDHIHAPPRESRWSQKLRSVSTAFTCGGPFCNFLTVDSDSVMTEVGSPRMGIGALSSSGVCVKVVANLEALNLVDNL